MRRQFRVTSRYFGIWVLFKGHLSICKHIWTDMRSCQCVICYYITADGLSLLLFLPPPTHHQLLKILIKFSLGIWICNPTTFKQVVRGWKMVDLAHGCYGLSHPFIIPLIQYSGFDIILFSLRVSDFSCSAPVIYLNFFLGRLHCIQKSLTLLHFWFFSSSKQSPTL